MLILDKLLLLKVIFSNIALFICSTAVKAESYYNVPRITYLRWFLNSIFT